MRASVAIDTDAALAVPGVRAVLTHEDAPKLPFSTARHEIPADRRRRHHGARHRRALHRPARRRGRCRQRGGGGRRLPAGSPSTTSMLPAVFDPEQAMAPGAPVIHDKGPEARIADARRNIVAEVHGSIGDVDRGLRRGRRHPRRHLFHAARAARASRNALRHRLDRRRRPAQRLRSSTQVPFLTRREICRLFALDPAEVRVFCERVGGGFGAKQEMLIEDIVALAALKTGRPVKLEFTREEQFIGATTRHPMRVQREGRRQARRHAHRAADAGRLQHRRLRQSRRAGARARLQRGARGLSLRQQEGRRLRRLHQHRAGRRLSRLRPAADQLRRRIRRSTRWPAPSAWSRSNSAAATSCGRATR